MMIIRWFSISFHFQCSQKKERIYTKKTESSETLIIYFRENEQKKKENYFDSFWMHVSKNHFTYYSQVLYWCTIRSCILNKITWNSFIHEKRKEKIEKMYKIKWKSKCENDICIILLKRMSIYAMLISNHIISSIHQVILYLSLNNNTHTMCIKAIYTYTIYALQCCCFLYWIFRFENYCCDITLHNTYIWWKELNTALNEGKKKQKFIEKERRMCVCCTCEWYQKQ